MAKAFPAVLAPLDVPIDLIERGLELVPIPAAHVGEENGALRLLATNRAFRLAGMGTDGTHSPAIAALSADITAFLASADTRREVAWEMGDAVDCRHYRVTLARSSRALRRSCQVHLIDLTLQRRTEQSLRREMTTDSLTGLPNREGFGDLIEAGLATGEPLAVLVVDLNRFGRLNACLGDLAGDELLITVARRIKGALRASDTLARIGGDAFGIMLAIGEREEAHHAAKRIDRTLADPFRLTGYEIGVECAVGIAFASGESEAEELIRHAQFAVKQGKASGRPEVYQRQAFAREREQFSLETALRRAIENRALRLNYQPICDLATGRLVAMEALARWRTDEGDDISPTRFVPVAEEAGLIVPLGRWAIEEATRTLAGWDARAGRPLELEVAVNLSPIQLQRDSLTAVVERALADAALPGARLKLELTESALVADPDRTAATMRSLKDLGTTLAMDDFGTGYSSLALLQQLPIDVLKIDRSFVTGMLADRDKVAIVRAILGLSQALGMKTVAEGVETFELAQTLGAMGCTFGQGFFYAQPLEAEEAWSLIAGTTPSA